MIELAKLMIVLCVNEHIPNPYTVNNLTKFQRELIYRTANELCTENIVKQYGLDLYNPECREKETCM